MKIAISLKEDKGLDSPISSIFGRCPFFMLINPEDNTYSVIPNQAKSASGGAGIQAAQMIANQDVEAIISGNIGPKALEVIQAANIAVYQFQEGSVHKALESFNAGELTALNKPSTGAHSG